MGCLILVAMAAPARSTLLMEMIKRLAGEDHVYTVLLSQHVLGCIESGFHNQAGKSERFSKPS